MKEIIIDGNRFNTYNGAYLEIRDLLSNGLENEALSIKKLLGKHVENKDEFIFIWENSDKSKKDLGYEETYKFYKKRMQTVPLHELVATMKEMKNAEDNVGATLFDKIIEALEKSNIKYILR